MTRRSRVKGCVTAVSGRGHRTNKLMVEIWIYKFSSRSEWITVNTSCSLYISTLRRLIVRARALGGGIIVRFIPSFAGYSLRFIWVIFVTAAFMFSSRLNSPPKDCNSITSPMYALTMHSFESRYKKLKLLEKTYNCLKNNTSVTKYCITCNKCYTRLLWSIK